MVSTPSNLDRHLREQFLQRKAKNPNYSQEAYARFLGVSSGCLSEVLSGKRSLTHKLAMRFMDRLGVPQAQESNEESDYALQQLNEDEFKFIEDWYHYGILNLIETAGFRNNIKWIAQRLGISTIEVRSALERLERLQLIEKRKNTLVRKQRVTTSCDVPSASLREAHRQNIQLALDKLETVDVKHRDFSTITFTANLSDLHHIKSDIELFRRTLLKKYAGQKGQEVYQLNLQLIPLTKGPKL